MKFSPFETGQATEAEALSALGFLIPHDIQTFLTRTAHCVKILSREGRVLYVNRAGRALLGRAELAQLTGQFWWDLWADAERPALQDGLACAVQGVQMRFQTRRDVPPAVQGMWDVTVAPVHAADGAIHAVMVVSYPV